MKRSHVFLPLVVASVIALPLAARPSPDDEVELTAARTGFRPAVVKLHRGDTTRVLLRSADGIEHCFAVDALRIEKRIQPGRVTPAEITPDKGGKLDFYCCLHPDDEAERGRLEVSE